MTRPAETVRADRAVWRYAAAAYLTFWLIVLVLCGGASMLLHVPPPAMRLLSNLCAWSPTFVLWAMLPRLRPGCTLGAFYRDLFRDRLSLPRCALYAAVTAGGSLLAAALYAAAAGIPLRSCFSAGEYSLGASALLSLTSGPLGEESGWRGYLRDELNRRYTFLRSSLIQGAVWAFWHTVLWFVDSDFTGLALIPYAAANVAVMTCLAVMMNAVLERRRNLLYAVVIHFAFNYVYCFLRVGLGFYGCLSAVFLLIAAGFLRVRTSSGAE